MTKRSKRIRISKKTVRSKGKEVDVYTVHREKPAPLTRIKKSTVEEQKFKFGSYGMVNRFSRRGRYIKDNLHDRWYEIDEETKRSYKVSEVKELHPLELKYGVEPKMSKESMWKWH